MKKVIVRNKLVKYNPVEVEIEYEKYETSDGKLHDTIELAEIHEKQYEYDSKFKAMKHIEIFNETPDLSDLDDWYKAKDEEELKMIIHDIERNHVPLYNISYYGDIKPNEWICYSYIDGGDSWGRVDVYTLTYIRKHIEYFLSMFDAK